MALIATLFFAPLTSAALLGPDSNSPPDGGAGGEPLAGEIDYQIYAGEYEIVEDEQGFHIINMLTPGYGIVESPGDPILPEKMLEFRVPQDIVWPSVELSVEIQESETLSGPYNIAPHPPLGPASGLEYDPEDVDWGVEKSILNGKNMYVYGRDADYPEHPVELLPYTERKEPIGEGEFEAVKYVRLTYRPFLYNPVTQKLTLIKKADVRISYDCCPEESEQIASSGELYEIVLNSTVFKSFYTVLQEIGSVCERVVKSLLGWETTK